MSSFIIQQMDSSMSTFEATKSWDTLKPKQVSMMQKYQEMKKKASKRRKKDIRVAKNQPLPSLQVKSSFDDEKGIFIMEVLKSKARIVISMVDYKVHQCPYQLTRFHKKPHIVGHVRNVYDAQGYAYNSFHYQETKRNVQQGKQLAKV